MKMKSGLFQQLRSFFSTKKSEQNRVLEKAMRIASEQRGDLGNIAPQTQPMTLPKFEDLQKNKPAVTTAKGLPSFAELQKMKEKNEKDKKKEAKKKARAPRPKNAKTLDVFKQQIGATGHALFYRYIRIPDENNGGLAGPKGGACILVNMVDDKSFSFSFSVCSPVDPFIKDESRRICQNRFNGGTGWLCAITRRDMHASCYDNIARAIENHFIKNSSLSEPLLTKGNKVTDQHLKLLARFIRSFK